VATTIEGPERREIAGQVRGDELEDTFRPDQILEAVLAQIAQGNALGESTSDQLPGRP
jgi:hypothetical protein